MGMLANWLVVYGVDCIAGIIILSSYIARSGAKNYHHALVIICTRCASEQTIKITIVIFPSLPLYLVIFLPITLLYILSTVEHGEYYNYFKLHTEEWVFISLYMLSITIICMVYII